MAATVCYRILAYTDKSYIVNGGYEFFERKLALPSLFGPPDNEPDITTTVRSQAYGM
jgi:hypothetical protein